MPLLAALRLPLHRRAAVRRADHRRLPARDGGDGGVRPGPAVRRRRVRLAASNPLSTQDDIAAALAARDDVAVFARAGVDRETYYEHIALALGAPGASVPGEASAPGVASAWGPGPDLILDDGGDLVSTLHTIAPPAVLGRVPMEVPQLLSDNGSSRVFSATMAPPSSSSHSRLVGRDSTSPPHAR